MQIIMFGEASIHDGQYSCPATVRTDVMHGSPKRGKTPFVVVIPRYILQFSKKSVIDTYTAFIRNVKRADEAIRIARQTKPAFDRFLQARWAVCLAKRVFLTAAKSRWSTRQILNVY